MLKYYTKTSTAKGFLTFDLETSFLRKGFKRPDTLILEIALYGKMPIEGKKRLQAFQRLVNPLKEYSSGQKVIEELHDRGQNPQNTIRFWTKLLIEKKMLNTSLRRKDYEEQADELSKLLSTDESFVDIKTALTDAVHFGNSCLWMAHNSKAFDSKIFHGNCEREGVVCSEIVHGDSLHYFRHYMPDQVSYSQPLLYKAMFKSKYLAHHALEDCKALHKMISVEAADLASLTTRLNNMPEKNSRQKRRSYAKVKTDLIDIKGVGPKSVQTFIKNNIRNKRDLYTWKKTNTIDEWLKNFKGVHHYKKLGERLFNGELNLINAD
jgi:predicted flap endonuclease-1-like 5' DNA nuclease